MASPRRRTLVDLRKAFLDRPQAFGFFQAMRLLSLQNGRENQGSALPRGVRLRTPASLAFPASDILRVTQKARKQGEGESEAATPPPMEVEVSLMGLTGPSGVLPATYTEMVMERRFHHQDTALNAFLDLFSHRALAQFFDAWVKYRHHMATELGQEGGFSQHLLDLTGLTLKVRQDRDALHGMESATAHFAGILGRRPLPSASIRAAIEGSLGVPVQLDQFVGRWMVVSPEERSRLGSRQDGGLGKGSILGERQKECQTAIRLVLGPLNRERFNDLLPGGAGERHLRELLQRLVGPTIATEIRLCLRKEDAPEPRMGAGSTFSLGRNSWLRSLPLAEDRKDTAYMIGG